MYIKCIKHQMLFASNKQSIDFIINLNFRKYNILNKIDKFIKLEHVIKLVRQINYF